MIASMRRSLCSAVNAQSCLAHLSATQEYKSKCVNARVKILNEQKDPAQDEKVLIYDRGSFEVMEYVHYKKNPMGFLWLRRKHDGKMLDLSQLLTGRFHFVPQAFANKSLETSKRRKILREYDCHVGNQFSNAIFLSYDVGTDHGSVSYRDITKPGGLFDILHEIIHVWQTMIWPVEMQAFSCINNAIKTTNFDSSRVGINNFNDILVKCTRKIFLQNIIDCKEDVEFNSSSYNMHLSTGDASFIFTSGSDVASRFLKQYMWKERHAWLTVLHLVKQLKKNFVDIEPTLDDSELKKHAHNSLQTHVKHINNMLRHDWRSVE